MKISGAGDLGALAAGVTGNSDWLSALPQWKTALPAGYEGYNFLFMMMLFYLGKTIIQGLGVGADPRFFGARSDRDCGRLSFMAGWTMMLRWPLRAGLGFEAEPPELPRHRGPRAHPAGRPDAQCPRRAAGPDPCGAAGRSHVHVQRDHQRLNRIFDARPLPGLYPPPREKQRTHLRELSVRSPTDGGGIRHGLLDQEYQRHLGMADHGLGRRNHDPHSPPPLLVAFQRRRLRPRNSRRAGCDAPAPARKKASIVLHLRPPSTFGAAKSVLVNGKRVSVEGESLNLGPLSSRAEVICKY